MNCSFLNSTVGKKVLVSLTGVILFGFVVLHMLGNLKAFMGVDTLSGQHHLDEYAHFLRVMGAPMVPENGLLWLTRIVLLLTLLVHVILVVQLRARNSAARPVGYKMQKSGAGAYAAYSMFWGGLFLFAFIVYHLLHFTTGHLHPSFVPGAVFANVSSAFKIPWVTGIYVLAMIALGLHLFHGLWSLFQTLGIDNPERNQCLRRSAQAFSFVVAVGFVSVPLCIFLGCLK